MASMGSPFNILQQSPLDCQAPDSDPAPQRPSIIKWVPSRYTIRATTDEGQLILWNTLSGAMSVFPAEQVPKVLSLIRRPGVEAGTEGWIKYLSEKGFIIEEGTNEYRKFQLVFGRQHYRTNLLQLILLSTEDCNFRCQYCYEKFARGTMSPWVRSAIKKLVEKRLKSLESLNIDWFGGEPLYGFQAIEDLAPFFLQVAQENSLHYRASMTTNGYLLTSEIASKLLSWKVNSYQITLDGVCEDHDRTRPTRDGQGSFQQIFENLRHLSQRSDDFHVSLRVNFDKNNYPNMERFLNIVEKTFKDDSRFRVNFHAVGRWGGPNDAQLDVCGTGEAAQVKEALQREAQKRGLNVGQGLKEVNSLGGDVCYAARPYNFIIGADGKLMKCTVVLDAEDYNVIGSIKSDGELELNDDRLALWTEPAFETDKKCQKCVVVPICQGIHCPLIRIKNKRSPCSSVRSSAKQALKKTNRMLETQARKVTVKLP